MAPPAPPRAALTPAPRPVSPSQVCIEKRRGEGLGVALVESGWGSLLPTAVIANLLHGGPAERSGALSIGDRLTAINGTSLVGLPLAACQAAVRVSPPRERGALPWRAPEGPRCSVPSRPLLGTQGNGLLGREPLPARGDLVGARAGLEHRRLGCGARSLPPPRGSPRVLGS